MKFLIQDINYPEQPDRGDVELAKAAREAGHEVLWWNVKECYTNDLPKDEPIAVHTSCTILKWVSRSVKTLTDFKYFRRQHYMSYWHKWLNRKSLWSFITVGAFNESSVCWKLPGGKFVAPDTNDKIFTGRVCKTFQDFKDLTYQCSPGTLIFASNVFDIKAECRFVIHNGKVLTYSWYRHNGEHNENSPDTGLQAPVNLAETIASKPFPGLPNLYVMDLACDDESWFLLEIGSIECAGIYSCDCAKIVEAMAMETEKAYNEEQ